YSYDRATIGLLDIRDMLYSLKPREVCTTWPCCSAIPGVSVGQTNGRSALFGKGSETVLVRDRSRLTRCASGDSRRVFVVTKAIPKCPSHASPGVLRIRHITAFL